MLLGTIGRLQISAIESHFGKKPTYSYRTEDFYCAVTGNESDSLFWKVPDNGGAVFIQGVIFDIKGTGPCKSGADLWEMYQQSGLEFLTRLNGDFSMVLRDEKQKKTFLVRDKIGAGLMYYSRQGEGTTFGTNLSHVAKLSPAGKELNTTAVLKYFMFNNNPGLETVYTGVYKLRPAHYLDCSESGLGAREYWRLRFDPQSPRSEEQIGAEIRQQLTEAVQKRVDLSAQTGAFLSGGLDSSSIVSLLHAAGKDTLKTFSFRCKGESFDESPFAKKVAGTFGTDHHLIEYGPGEVLQAEAMVGLMEEPFCDVGINIATYLLAQAAKDTVENIFTGDGGDELFAGHPVYTADKAARMLDRIPSFLLAPLFAIGRSIKDSEKKKDFRVKVKRFSESFSYPKALGTHRWRVYYQPGDLGSLLTGDFLGQTVVDEHLFDDLITYNNEITTADPLARSLYSDYQTAVQFYLRRLDMAKSMGLNTRVPMLDPELAQYCAGVPSALKLPGMSDVKHIEKVAVEPILPHEIVHRKDKLGHSIPLKNWMRDNRIVRNFMMDVLSDQVLVERGIIRPEAVRKMIADHDASKKNNSHRLWSLMIFELWLRHHVKSA